MAGKEEKSLPLLTYLKHLKSRTEELKAKHIQVEITVESLNEIIDALEATA